MSVALHAGRAAALVAGALASTPQGDRPDFLRALLAHAAAGLVVVEGRPDASEAVYRLADAVAIIPERAS